MTVDRHVSLDSDIIYAWRAEAEMLGSVINTLSTFQQPFKQCAISVNTITRMNPDIAVPFGTRITEKALTKLLIALSIALAPLLECEILERLYIVNDNIEGDFAHEFCCEGISRRYEENVGRFAVHLARAIDDGMLESMDLVKVKHVKMREFRAMYK